MADYTEILYHKQRNGVLITFNRPQAMNAISRTILREMHHALDAAEADPEIRAVVLTGAGRAFSAGMDQGGGSPRKQDIVWPYGIPTDTTAAELIDSWRTNRGKFMRIWEFSKPVIGAINGWTMGAGSWLACFTHITIASEDAVFAQPEVRHGSNTSFMWTLLAGFKNALRYGLTGDHVDAQEALRIGLVNKVVPRDQLIDECFRIVERIALVPPETVKINLHIANMATADDGPPRRFAHGRSIIRSCPRHAAGGIQTAPGRSATQRRHQGVPETPRRALPTGAVRTEVKKQAIGISHKATNDVGATGWSPAIDRRNS